MGNSHRHPNIFHLFSCRTKYFKNSFFPHVIIEWNKLDPNIRSSNNHHVFRNALFKFITPVDRKIFKISEPFGIKMLTRVRLGFSHLHEHKFRNGFKDILNPLCFCSTEAETTTHYILHCHFYNSNEPPLRMTWKIFTFFFYCQ